MKILIVLDNIHTGGISKSLLNLLPVIAEKGQCDLLIFNYHNLNKDLIPENVNLLIPDDDLHILGMSQKEILKYSKKKYMFRLFLVLLSRVVSGDFSRKILFRKINDLTEYDLAISYSQDVGWKTISTGCNHFVMDKVQAKYKAAFIHCDYEQFGGYDKRQERIYKQFDRIVCVSEACKNSFIRMFPKLKEKCCVCENFINKKEIQEKIEDGYYKYNDNFCSIVTVCRLSDEKGLLRVVDALGELYREGYSNFKWTIVGDGPEYKNIKTSIEKNKLQDYINLVGQKSNPFYYVKDAKFFLLPSLHEAAPMVFGECQALGVPIVTTNTISAKELVEDRGLGIVCENNKLGIYSIIKDIFDGKVLLPKLSEKQINKLNHYANKQLNDFLESFK